MNSNFRRELMAVFDAAVTPAGAPPKPKPDPAAPQPGKYNTPATHKLACWCAKEQRPKELASARAAVLKFAPKLKATLKRLDGHSHNDAVRNAKAQRADFCAGDRTETPERIGDVIRQESEYRRAVRSQAVLISEEASAIAADFWESLVPTVPDFRKKVEGQLKEIFPEHQEFGASPVLTAIDDLPRFLTIQAAKLRRGACIRGLDDILPTAE